MTYTKGDKSISVIQLHGYKNKGLYVGKKNNLTKVASFSGEEEAALFCSVFEDFLKEAKDGEL